MDSSKRKLAVKAPIDLKKGDLLGCTHCYVISFVVKKSAKKGQSIKLNDLQAVEGFEREVVWDPLRCLNCNSRLEVTGKVFPKSD